MDFTQKMDNGYMIPTSVAVGSGEATDIRCVCDTVEDFKAFLDTTGMELRYEGLVTYEKVNKLLKVYKGNDTWQTVGEGGNSVDASSFITLTQLSQQLSNYCTEAQIDNKIAEEISKIELKEGPQGPKGDKGDVGPQGPKGAEYNDTELRNLISSLIKRIERLENNEPVLPDVPVAPENIIPVFTSDNWIYVEGATNVVKEDYNFSLTTPVSWAGVSLWGWSSIKAGDIITLGVSSTSSNAILQLWCNGTEILNFPMGTEAREVTFTVPDATGYDLCIVSNEANAEIVVNGIYAYKDVSSVNFQIGYEKKKK